MGNSFRLGHVLGIPIGINYSWLIVFSLITFLMGRYLGEAYGWPTAQKWGVALGVATLFFISVLAHELSHSLVARRLGIPVHGITLFIFGGVSHLGHEAPRPRVEFLVALVGPLCSFALAIGFGVLWWEVGERSQILGAVLGLLLGVNLSLGVFNLLPGFPLDGGRALRASIWAVTGSYWRATQIATRCGQGIGGLLIAGGAAWLIFMPANRFQGLWLALVGTFIIITATMSYRQERDREPLRRHKMSGVPLNVSWRPLPADTPLTSPLVELAFVSGAEFIGVTQGERPVGIATRQDLNDISPYRWSDLTLGQVMLPLRRLPGVALETPLYNALEQAEAVGAPCVSVWRDKKTLAGFASRDDLIRAWRTAQSQDSVLK